jgi:glutamate-1-semialdehyde 2,1-aminomutase
VTATHTSTDWDELLRARIPWGASTISKAPRYRPQEPAVIVRGQGCRVWDDQGREFIDYRLGLGPVTLGYRHPAVDEAVRRQLESGIVFGHCHPLEAQVAQLLCQIVPCAQQARFLKTGGEAIAACIRAARAFTGRDHVIQVGYNGWLNSLASGGRVLPGERAQGAPPGVPPALAALHHSCPWNDLLAMEQVFDAYSGQIAAVVIASDYAQIDAGRTYYPAVRQLCDRHGAVLIFDEIVTGFRLALAGAQQYFGVTPDMAVFAKGMANGMPLSAYVGRREVMAAFGKAIVSSTYGGEALSLAAARATIEVYQQQDVVGHLWRQGQKLWSEFNAMMKSRELPLVMKGAWPCPALQCEAPDPATRGRWIEQFMRTAYAHGLSLYTVCYVNFSHQDRDLDETLQRLERVCGDLQRVRDDHGGGT